jgi:AraC-like DNA-binding protein
VALSVGFSDQSHFTRVFARECGETPSAFRRRFR